MVTSSREISNSRARESDTTMGEKQGAAAAAVIIMQARAERPKRTKTKDARLCK